MKNGIVTLHCEITLIINMGVQCDYVTMYVISSIAIYQDSLQVAPSLTVTIEQLNKITISSIRPDSARRQFLISVVYLNLHNTPRYILHTP